MARVREAGFTLVEVLVAIGLMAMALLAIAPMFVGAVKNNAVGWDYSELNGLARQRLEELLQMNQADDRLAVPAASTMTIDGRSGIVGKLYVDTLPTSLTVSGYTTTYPYELRYTVQDFLLSDIPASGAPNPSNGKVDTDATWAASGVKYITVYAGSARGSLQGSAYGTSSGVLSTADTGKQVRMSAVKAP